MTRNEHSTDANPSLMTLWKTTIALAIAVVFALSFFAAAQTPGEPEITMPLIQYLDQRFNVLDERFNAMDERFNTMETSINQRFDAIDKRFGAVEKRLDNIESAIHGNPGDAGIKGDIASLKGWHTATITFLALIIGFPVISITIFLWPLRKAIPQLLQKAKLSQ